MSKLASVCERRPVFLILICVSLVGLVSVLSFFLTNDVLSTLWLKLTIANDSSSISPPWQPSDPSSCLSRTQQHLFRNPKYEQPMPPNVTAAWNAYTHLHKSCFRANWIEAFLKRDSFDDGGNACQYVVYIEGREGLGNRLLSLASAFVFAMATDRVLLLDNRKNIPNLLCEPFPNSRWLLPADFPYKKLLDSFSLGPFMQGGDINATSTVSLNLQHTLNWQDQQIFCEEAYSSLKNVKWVAWTSNQYFIPNFFLVPSFWNRIHPIFGDDVDHLFTYISRLLFLPNDATWAIIVREYWSYLSGAMTRLGVQVRRPDLAKYNSEVNDKVMKCLVENELLPGFSQHDNVTELSMEQNTSMPEGNKKRDVDIVVLVASLQGGYAETMKDSFGFIPTEGTKMVRVQTVSHQGTQNRGLHQAQLAFVEMWLLSFSDNLATSGYSTFGYIAQGLGGLEPLILLLKKRDDAKSCCVWGQSVEPCNHYPRQPGECFGSNARLSVEHKQWIRDHLRMCQDHPGWQIVHGGVGGIPVPFGFL